VPTPVTGPGLLPTPTFPELSVPESVVRWQRTPSSSARGCASAATVVSRSELSSASGAPASAIAAAAGADGKRGKSLGAGVNAPGRSAYGERSSRAT
jgi:hypothetical protein